MVVTGFEIFGAVSGALGTLDLVRQLVASICTFERDWKEAGHKILETRDAFETYVVRLEAWSGRTWLIDPQFNDDVGRAYWGEPGWRSITSQLGYIDKTAQDFLIIFNKAVDPGFIAQMLPQHEGAFTKAEEATPGEWHDRTGLCGRRRGSVGKLRELGDRLADSIHGH